MPLNRTSNFEKQCRNVFSKKEDFWTPQGTIQRRIWGHMKYLWWKLRGKKRLKAFGFAKFSGKICLKDFSFAKFSAKMRLKAFSFAKFSMKMRLKSFNFVKLSAKMRLKTFSFAKVSAKMQQKLLASHKSPVTDSWQLKI